MNKSIYKIIIGAFFIAAGIYGYLAKTGMLQLLALAIGAYGVYNIGWGIYLRKKEKRISESESEN
ncbi:hypothetical protein [Parvicella tangerina]|uniref:Uncharacterized protein n=1 Tax=Parvicella tangerina TaxID=2829795 RepID=A0A916JMM3_9FLAO|nr:hypothetical protein [Parvicella tangerina]CAG5083310.1 hypothetical protein CRYO30217_02158 [Parvicella tangerina]